MTWNNIIGQGVAPQHGGFWGHPGLAPPVRQAIPPPQHPATHPPVTHPPVAQPHPAQTTPPVTQPTTPTHPSTPPTSHHRHHDYAFVEGYGWWPRWFPYWEPYWFWFWQYLYYYYGGDTNAEFAEYARDWYLRSIAPQWGWY